MSKHNLTSRDQSTEFLLCTAPNSVIKVEVLLSNESIWLKQRRMAELFGVGVPAIPKHLKNIFDSGELEEEVVVSILETTTEHGTVAERDEYQEVGARRCSVFRLHRGHHRAPQCIHDEKLC